MHLLDEHGYVAREVFRRLEGAPTGPAGDSAVKTAADLVRFNALLSVARAGTGHLGASLSMAETVAELYFRRGRFDPSTAADPDRDIFVLSKGHAAPLQYALLAAKGYFGNDRLNRLRRWNGLPGHSHTSVPGVEANTGSLGMGISKAVGWATVRQRFAKPGRVWVIVGDAEIQEGQVWEALLSAAGFACPNLTVIIDDNRVQTDQFTRDILVYRDLPGTLKAMGFAVDRADGNDPASLRTAFDRLDAHADKPKLLIADTLKGAGVSYMEHPACLKTPADRYVWHNRPPNSDLLKQAHGEILARVRPALTALGIVVPDAPTAHVVPIEPPATGIKGKPLVPAFAEALVAWGKADPKLLVLDADLEDDCGLTPFRKAFPDRFLELAIMEMHMCSAASAFCSAGFVPVINSYAAFLTSRSNEQIYNLCCDTDSRFLLVGHLTGVIPATPGQSHQAFRDISCLRSIPGLRLVQPATPADARRAVERFAAGELGPRVYLRMSAAPSALELPDGGCDTAPGRSFVVRAGKHAVLIAAGPVLLGECLAAAELLAGKGIEVEVRNHPWLGEFDAEEVSALVARKLPIVVAEDHHRAGGLGECLFTAIAACGASARLGHVCLTDLPDTGFRTEALDGMGIGRTAIAAAVANLAR